jgi:tripartite-type tricarboxylate transporter receptor subunit TctC
VIVENKPGGFGAISTEYLARSKADGYTIGILPGSSFLAAAAHLFKKLPYDPVNDFEHVTTLARLPFILVVSGDSPYKSVADLTKFLKERGDKASYGSLANIGLVSSELYKAQFGLETVEVKYKDAAAGLNDLWGGNIVFTHIDPAGGAAHLKSGKLRPLATTSAKRLQALPDIPSAHESGIMNTDLTAWWSVHVPKGVPKPVLTKLEDWFNKIAVDEETVKWLALNGTDPLPGNSTLVKEMLVKDIQAWGEYVRLAKIEQLG